MPKTKKEKTPDKKKPAKAIKKVAHKPAAAKTAAKKHGRPVAKAKKILVPDRLKPAVVLKKTVAPAPAPVKSNVVLPHSTPQQHKPAAAVIVATPHDAAPKPVVPPVPAPVPVKEMIKAKPEVKKEPPQPQAPVPQLKELQLELPINVKDLAIKLQEKPSIIIKALMDMGMMTGINQTLDPATVANICQKYGFKVIEAPDAEARAMRSHEETDRAQDLMPRSPIVTFMGHVDHGKTSLLDAIRKTKVAESEHGGITQHIGAYRVRTASGEITFLDTPGHEAFTAMRARGANITDIVVLVVAADDWIMPQTEEAIDHARAASVPIIVAVNKIDKPQADLDRVKKQLMNHELTAEDWGGKTITVPVSAKTGEGIDNLLEMILLEAQMLELKCNPARLARGIVIEAKMSKGRGPVSTLLVENGTLHLNDNIIVGNFYGKVRAMFNALGLSVTSAAPSVPVEVLGISDIPQAGEQFYAIADEKQAKELAEKRAEKQKMQQQKAVKRISLEDLHAQIQEGKIKELKIILKADVQGSLEAIKDTLDKLNVSEIKLDIIHTGVGNINSSDVVLAMASNALVVGFNVTADERSKELAAKEEVEIKTYNIIYELANEIKAAVEGMLEPKIKKVFLGRAEIRKVFKLSRSGTVAGCFVTKGKFNRAAIVEVNRNGEVVFEGKFSALKRFKDDVKEVLEGFECGMSFAGYDGMREGDIVEAYEIEKIARTL